MDLGILVISCVLLFASATHAQERECPPPEHISPCTCETYSAIYCTSVEVPFSQVFGALEEFAAETDQNYHWDYVQFNRIINNEIPTDAFGNLTFRALVISEGETIRRVDPVVFAKMANKLEFVYFTGNQELENAEELFQGLSSVQSLKDILILDGKYDKIPANAFKAQRFLESFEFNGQVIENIGERPFYEPTSLNSIKIQRNLYFLTPSIHPAAFEFKDPSDNELLLSINQFGLTPAVLESVNLTGFNGRSVDLDLSGNRELTYLSESTFKPFLDANHLNQIRIGILGDCESCEHAWLVRDGLVDVRVLGDYAEIGIDKVKCQSNDEIMDLGELLFTHCTK